MPSSLFQRLKPGMEIPACYDVQTCISIYCLMEIWEVDSHCERFEASIGIRDLADTALPVGSKLTIKLQDLDEEDRQGIYYTAVVDAVRRHNKRKVDVHSIKLKEKVVPNYHRAHARIQVETEAVRGNDIQFQTSNISAGGLQLTYGAQLTSAVLNQPMQLTLNLDGIKLDVECIPRYIQYNWWEREHTVGTCFNNLSLDYAQFIHAFIQDRLPPEERALYTDQFEDSVPQSVGQAMLSDLELPVAKQTMIDPESGRIRFQ